MGLRLKFTVMISALFVLAGVMLSGFFLARSKVSLESQLRNRGVAMVRSLAYNSADALSAGDSDALADLVRGLQYDSDIVYVMMLDGQGRVLAHSQPGEIGKLYSDENSMKDLKVKEAWVRSAVWRDQAVYDVVHPVRRGSGAEASPSVSGESAGSADAMGIVRIGLSLSRIRADMRTTLAIGTVLLLAVVGIGITISVLFVRLMIGPLERMAKAAAEVADGNFTQKIDVATRDEVGVLGNSFLKMSGKLAETIMKVKDVSKSMTEVASSLGGSNKKLLEGAEIQVGSTQRTLASVQELDGSARDIASSVEVLSSTASETSSSVLQMSASISEVASTVAGLAATVSDTSTSIGQMSASVRQVAENVEELSSAAEMTASAINEISATLGEVEANAKESAKLTEQVSMDARELGMKSIEKTIEAMNRIQETVVKSAEVINRLGSRSEQIGKILTVISDVTKQTNLLALNAAILAAQAGDQGKGFAVVADEIKSLSDRTSASTKEISQLISGVQSEARDAVESIRLGAKSVEQGVSLSLEAGEALKKILESSTRSTDMAKRIEAATVEQNRGVQQVTGAMERVNMMLQQIVQATQEQSRGSLLISESSDKMSEMTSRVRMSTEEQARGSREITKAIENINEKLHQILGAVHQQKQGMEVIVKSVGEIRRIAAENNLVAGTMDQTLASLMDQAATLKSEMGRFRL